MLHDTSAGQKGFETINETTTRLGKHPPPLPAAACKHWGLVEQQREQQEMAALVVLVLLLSVTEMMALDNGLSAKPPLGVSADFPAAADGCSPQTCAGHKPVLCSAVFRVTDTQCIVLRSGTRGTGLAVTVSFSPDWMGRQSRHLPPTHFLRAVLLCCCAVNEAVVRTAADRLVELGLAAAGYSYLNTLHQPGPS